MALLLAVASVALVAPALGHDDTPAAGGELVVESSRSGATTVTGKAADEPKFFKLQVYVDGQFTADYGEHPGPNQSDYSGQASTTYSSDLVSVARWRPGEDGIDGKFQNTKGRATVTETTSVVSHFPGSPDSEFVCDNGGKTQTGSTLAPRAGNAVQPGGWVRNYGSTGTIGTGQGGEHFTFSTAGPYFDGMCFDSGHSPLNHYLIQPTSSNVLEADTSTISNCCDIPRGAFNPKFDRKYSETFSRSVSYDSGPNPQPGPFPIHMGPDYPHEFDGSSSASVKIKQLSERKAKRLRKKFRDLGEDLYEPPG
jgi:hypothetical protein